MKRLVIVVNAITGKISHGYYAGPDNKAERPYLNAKLVGLAIAAAPETSVYFIKM